MYSTAKVHTLPCHCCAIHSSRLATPNSVLCNLCQELHPDEENWRCYHHSSLTPEKLAEMQLEFDEAEASLGPLFKELDETHAESIINPQEDPRAPLSNSRGDPKSIHFELWSSEISEREKTIMEMLWLLIWPYEMRITKERSKNYSSV